MSNVITNDALAKIAIAKNLVKEYKTAESDRVVYLNNGTEFQIYLKNPYQTHLGIKISVNNKSMGDNLLVLRPGQSFWLDRFINENKKLLFSTYEVENTAEMKYATAQNGKITLQFYHEKETVNYPVLSVSTNNNFYNSCLNDIVTCGDSVRCYNSVDTISDALNYTSGIPTTSGCTFNANANANSNIRSMRKSISNITRQEVDASIETGRVEKGGRSDQEFDRCDIEFEYWSFKTETIQILPNSRKQIRPEETRRRYCSQCGKKVNPKDKFCSNCGAKLI